MPLFSLFLFENFLLFKPATPNKRLVSHTAQLCNQTRDYPGQGPSLSNSSQPVSIVSVGEHHPCVFASSSLFPPETSSIQVHPRVAQTALYGREGSPLSDSLPRILQQTQQALGLGLQPPWSLRWPQGPYCPEALSLPSDFSMSSTVLPSNLHICWDTVGCSLCSSVDWVGVSPMCRGKWNPLPPIECQTS